MQSKKYYMISGRPPKENYNPTLGDYSVYFTNESYHTSLKPVTKCNSQDFMTGPDQSTGSIKDGVGEWRGRMGKHFIG